MNPAKDKIDKSLKYSFLDATFFGGMMGFTQDYFTPFLLLLGGTVKSVGVLSSLPNLVAALIQLESADLTEKVKSRKKIVQTFVLFQALMLLPMAWFALKGGAPPISFIILVTLFTSLGAFAIPAFGSMMSDLVSDKKRGEFFGKRNLILGLVMVSASLCAGLILNVMQKINIFHGFAIVFILACFSRIISWFFLSRMYEPPLEHKKEHYFNIFMFLARVKHSNFAKFVLYVSSFTFCVYLASPFFAVLMLREWHFSYLLYTGLTVTSTVTVYLLMGRWGQHADKVGNLQVMRITAPIIGSLPLFWVFSPHPLCLFFAQIVSGFAWAGFNLCASNFIYDAVTPQKRTRCIAYFNVFNGLALCAGGLTGGFLIEKLPPFLGHKILTLFLISAALRIIVGFIFPTKLKEVRSVENITNNQLFFSMIGIKPVLDVERKTVEY
jgi:MFS family permease